MEQNFSKRFLEWSDIDRAVERLALNIEDSKQKIGAIKGIARGGLIPAVLLSHRLGIPYITEDDNSTEDYILVVDDICDTGETLKEYSKYESILIATLHYKTSAMIEPDFWWKIAPENEWIVYPWERKDSKIIPDYATKRK
jgi:hypoxanthine phosphoribosyltransferase